MLYLKQESKNTVNEYLKMDNTEGIAEAGSRNESRIISNGCDDSAFLITGEKYEFSFSRPGRKNDKVEGQILFSLKNIQSVTESLVSTVLADEDFFIDSNGKRTFKDNLTHLIRIFDGELFNAIKVAKNQGNTLNFLQDDTPTEGVEGEQRVEDVTTLIELISPENYEKFIGKMLNHKNLRDMSIEDMEDIQSSLEYFEYLISLLDGETFLTDKDFRLKLQDIFISDFEYRATILNLLENPDAMTLMMNELSEKSKIAGVSIGCVNDGISSIESSFFHSKAKMISILNDLNQLTAKELKNLDEQQLSSLLDKTASSLSKRLRMGWESSSPLAIVVRQKSDKMDTVVYAFRNDSLPILEEGENFSLMEFPPQIILPELFMPSKINEDSSKGGFGNIVETLDSYCLGIIEISKNAKIYLVTDWWMKLTEAVDLENLNIAYQNELDRAISIPDKKLIAKYIGITFGKVLELGIDESGEFSFPVLFRNIRLLSNRSNRQLRSDDASIVQM